MPEHTVTDDQIAAWLQELLPLDQLATVERLLRENEALRRRAAALAMARDSGAHSLGAIWRSERLSCPDRKELGASLLGTLDDAQADYVAFHVRVLGCRYCAANLADLRTASRTEPAVASRRRKYFESSAGHFRRTSRED